MLTTEDVINPLYRILHTWPCAHCSKPMREDRAIKADIIIPGTEHDRGMNALLCSPACLNAFVLNAAREARRPTDTNGRDLADWVQWPQGE